MVDGPNTYGFCGGDPVNRSDPMGTDWVVIDTKDRLVQPFADEARADAIDLAFRIGGRVEYMAPDRVAKLDAARKFTGIILAREFDDRPPVEMVTLAGPMGTRQLGRAQWDAEKAEARAAQAAFQRLAEARNAAEANAQADMVDLGGGVQMLNPFSARGTQRLSDVAPEAFEMVGGINWREASAGELALWAITLPAGGKGAQLARGGKKVYVALRKGEALVRRGQAVKRVLQTAKGIKTGIAYWDELVAGTKQFERWAENLKSRGYTMVKDANMIEDAVITSDKVVRYNPGRFTRLTLGHETVHIGFIERELKKGVHADDVFDKLRRAGTELDAYHWEKRMQTLKQEWQFSKEMNDALGDQIRWYQDQFDQALRESSFP